MAIVYLGNAGGGSGGGVQDVTAADTSVVVGGTAAHPTVRTGTLDVIAADHAPAADWSNNSHKITSLANGSAASDAQAYGQGVASLLTAAGDTVYASAANTLARLGIGAAGQVLGLSGGVPAWVYPPGYEIGYDPITSNVNVTGTSAAAPTTVITCSAHTFDGAAVLLTVTTPVLYLGTANNTFMTVTLWESGAQLGVLGQTCSPVAAGGLDQIPSMSYRFTPSAGSHSYLIRAWVTSTTGTPVFGAGSGGTGNNSFFPAAARFTKV